MPRFYFDFDDNGSARADREGSELPDRNAAGEEVVAVLPELLKGLTFQQPEGSWRLTARVRDETGTYIFEGELILTTKWLF